MTAFNGKLAPQAWMATPETQKVMAALGPSARFVGGCVRDALANRRVVDIDIATPMTPDAVIAQLTAHDIKHAPTGIAHGTVTAIVNGHPFEITTLRRDIESFGRHATVAFTDDWKADAARRDFTINAMSATIDGAVFDPFGGIEDLRQGHVRFVGDAATRINEDVLRILRFFRFYASFGRGEPDVNALNACRAHAEKIKTLSAERLRQETLKLLNTGNAAHVWSLMIDCGVVAQFLPAATHADRLMRLVDFEVAHQSHEADAAIRRLAALSDDADETIRALRLSNDEAARLRALRAHDVLPNDAAIRVAVYRHGNDTVRSLILLDAARRSLNDDADFAARYHTATSFRPPRFPITGGDVLALGHKPGPAVGDILSQVEDWWIAQDFAPGRTACLEKLRSLS